ncbi:cytochrome c oxidase accessory protein CcoG [Rubellimicrobium sp. CFH 75288]|uniref:cytochrome c oxidase accessory protein CcoG n=1 Tax=Rubellimicrobium sp. CFH 75288 TaxID=2697034 RepID=UPI001412BA4A|nr:cytochrome c oxidase accessory protein CcoG [Rubellimicrobium sp. CFH 75288]NAZ36734.1 cytochrome c oxidase accessory protein CcoG [Rubellimicrobium sp. CFH 75288]
MSHAPAPSLYAAREPVFPRRVRGRFRRLKWWVMAATLGLYYVLPWLRWDRGEGRPDQAVLVDLAGRRFFFFFVEIWPQDFHVVAGLLVMAGLGLFLFTSVLGRVWCGYACPQTVWTDLFLLTERWVEGDRNARLRLWHAPWSLAKARLRLAKWAIWLVIALATGGAWVFYFADAPTLLAGLVTGTAPPVAYTTVAVLTATTVAFGGFAREQICIYACPWPRIQSALTDEETLTIGYRAWRGEPRGKASARGADAPPPGDCVDCRACAAVCPMGIDIRDGQQLACITCALCIDACDDVMTRLGRPRGLIGYFTLTDERAERAGRPPRPVRQHVLRPRTILYATLWSLAGALLLAALALRAPLDLDVSPVRNPVFITLSDGTIRNAYDLRLRNKSGETRDLALSVQGDASLALSVEGHPDGIVTVPADATASVRLYLDAPPGSPAATGGRTPLRLVLADPAADLGASADTHFTGKAP